MLADYIKKPPELKVNSDDFLLSYLAPPTGHVQNFGLEEDKRRIEKIGVSFIFCYFIIS